MQGFFDILVVAVVMAQEVASKVLPGCAMCTEDVWSVCERLLSRAMSKLAERANQISNLTYRAERLGKACMLLYL